MAVESTASNLHPVSDLIEMDGIHWEGEWSNGTITHRYVLEEGYPAPFAAMMKENENEGKEFSDPTALWAVVTTLKHETFYVSPTGHIWKPAKGSGIGMIPTGKLDTTNVNQPKIGDVFLFNPFPEPYELLHPLPYSPIESITFYTGDQFSQIQQTA